MNRSVLALLLPLISGCDFHSKNPSKDDGNVTINADESGQVSFNFPFAKGSVKLPESMIHNGNMVINGVPMIPGGKMSGFHLDTANKASVVTMNFTAPQSPDEVRSYFVDQFKKQGVDVSLKPAIASRAGRRTVAPSRSRWARPAQVAGQDQHRGQGLKRNRAL